MLEKLKQITGSVLIYDIKELIILDVNEKTLTYLVNYKQKYEISVSTFFETIFYNLKIYTSEDDDSLVPLLDYFSLLTVSN